MNQTSIIDFFPKGTTNNISKEINIEPEKGINKYFSKESFLKDKNLKDCNLSESPIIEDKNVHSKISNSTNFNIFSNDIIERIEVYTDGSTVNNGKKNASGGIGVFFYLDDMKNLSEKYNSNNVTNQKCELLAIVKALQIIKSKFGRHSKKINVLVHTDSDYCIKCMTNYVKVWLRNNWKLRNGNNVKNRNLIELLLNLTNEFNNVSYNHIRSHQVEPTNKDSLEYKVWYGNMMADKLANQGRSKGYFKK